MPPTNCTSPEKKCSKCGAVYPRAIASEYFWKHTTSKDGLRSWCKVCQGASNRAYVATDVGREVMHKADKKFSQGEHGKQQKREKRKRYSFNNPQKELARRAVNHAVRRGDLPRVKTVHCVQCGNKAETYHHHSYEPEYWLDVVPLCRSCHKDVHAKMGVIE